MDKLKGVVNNLNRFSDLESILLEINNFPEKFILDLNGKIAIKHNYTYGQDVSLTRSYVLNPKKSRTNPEQKFNGAVYQENLIMDLSDFHNLNFNELVLNQGINNLNLLFLNNLNNFFVVPDYLSNLSSDCFSRKIKIKKINKKRYDKSDFCYELIKLDEL